MNGDALFRQIKKNQILALSVILSANFFSQPIFAQSNLQRMEYLIQDGRFQEANTYIEKLLKQSPRNYALHLAFAKFLRMLGENEAAINEFQICLQLQPHSYEALVALSEMYALNANYEESLHYARMAVDYAPDADEGHIALTSALIKCERVNEAEIELSKLLSKHAVSPALFFLAYQLESRRGNVQRAKSYLEEAHKADPGRLSYTLELCDFWEKSGEHKKARVLLNAAVAANPDDIEARQQLARNLEVYSQDWDGAIVQYKQILRLVPDSVSAFTGIDRCTNKKNNIALRLKLYLQNLFTSRS